MQFIAPVVMLAAAVALFVLKSGGWFVGLFALRLLAQLGAVFDQLQRWRRKG